jgi:transcriptional regulator with XRE-family HTH domain
MTTPHRPSIAVRHGLRKLGQDIRDARRRRGLPAGVVAERAFTSRPTLQRVERGDASVSIGIYAAVLQALGLLDGLSQLADPARDLAGLAMAASAYPTPPNIREPRWLTSRFTSISKPA